MSFTFDKADLKQFATSVPPSLPHLSKLGDVRTGPCASVAHLPTRLDGLIARVTPLPADEVGDEDDEDQPCQGPAHSNGDQHVVTVLYTLFHRPKPVTFYPESLDLHAEDIEGERLADKDVLLTVALV